MKKNAFTLAELLITLGVVAVAAALLIPGLARLVPDQNKIKILNANSVISTAADNLLNDDSKYNCDNETNETLSGFACDSSVPGGTSESESDKFEKLMVEELGLVDSGDVNLPWKSTNGAFWGFSSVGNGNDKYYIITIDLNGSKSPNEVFSDSQNNPDRYRFKVNNYGGVIPNDALTEAYLRNSLKSNMKGENKEVAKKLLSTKTYK